MAAYNPVMTKRVWAITNPSCSANGGAANGVFNRVSDVEIDPETDVMYTLDFSSTVQRGRLCMNGCLCCITCPVPSLDCAAR